MDMFRQEWETLLPDIEDWSRTEGIEMIKQYRSPLAVGDTVCITGDVCKGLVGELKVIDEHNDDEGDYFGVQLDTIEGYVFFRADEIERVENKVELVPQNCDKCGQKRKTLTNTGTEAYPVWKCGTCLHREARRINTREMYGRGRRGY